MLQRQDLKCKESLGDGDEEGELETEKQNQEAGDKQTLEQGWGQRRGDDTHAH